MPFASIVGVNNQSILLDYTLLSNKTIESFVRVFRTLKEVMGGLEPRNIIIDQDKAMKAPIALVFLDVVHRCCKFYVVSKACEKLGWLINSSEEFANEFDSCINHTKMPEEFELMWHSLEEKYNLHKNEAF
jgi:hypothetical protein